MDVVYAPSLVWVCLACGQLAPYHANPNDLLDSADAIDYSLTQASPSRPHSAAMASVPNDEVFRSPGELRRSHHPHSHHSYAHPGSAAGGHRYVDNDSLLGSSGGDEDGGAAGHPLYSGQGSHSHRSPSRGHAHSCLNDESDSYLSMAAAQSDHMERSNGQPDSFSKRRQTSWGVSSFGHDSGHYHHHHHHHHQQGRSGSPTSPYAGSPHVSLSAGPGAATDAGTSMQSIAALLMEEHLVGSREMRFCESCHEVRCAEIRKASEMVPPAMAAADGSQEPMERRADYTDTRPYHSSASNGSGGGGGGGGPHSPLHGPHSPHSDAQHTGQLYPHGNGDDDEGHSSSVPDPTSAAFLYACQEPGQQILSSDVKGAPHNVHQAGNAAARRASPTSSSSSATARAAAERPKRRDIPSGHLVVAVSLARLLLKLKAAATSVLTNFHPLSPSLPAAYFRRSGADADNNDSDGDNAGGDGQRDDDELSMSPTLLPHDRGSGRGARRTAAATTPSSYETVVKCYPAPCLSSTNSSLDEATLTNGMESNGISYNSFRTSPSHQHQQLPSPHHQQQQEKQRSWTSQDYVSSNVDEHALLEGETCAAASATEDVAAHTQLLFPATCAEPVQGGTGPSLLKTPTTSTTAAVLRACKDKWNTITVSEAFWRLVLPTFGAPFLGSALTCTAATSRGGSCPSTPQREAGGSMDGSQKPYRGFRGEVEEAVGRLDDMQLEVAKLRLEQILAALTAEQQSRGEVDTAM